MLRILAFLQIHILEGTLSAITQHRWVFYRTGKYGPSPILRQKLNHNKHLHRINGNRMWNVDQLDPRNLIWTKGKLQVIFGKIAHKNVNVFYVHWKYLPFSLTRKCLWFINFHIFSNTEQRRPKKSRNFFIVGKTLISSHLQRFSINII